MTFLIVAPILVSIISITIIEVNIHEDDNKTEIEWKLTKGYADYLDNLD